MHNIKEAIYENKSKLEGIGEDYQIQVGDHFSVMAGLDFLWPLLLTLDRDQKLTFQVLYHFFLSGKKSNYKCRLSRIMEENDNLN